MGSHYNFLHRGEKVKMMSSRNYLGVGCGSWIILAEIGNLLEYY